LAVQQNALIRGFSRKRALVTGHTGFKGAWLSLILRKLDCEVLGLSLTKRENELYSIIPSNYFKNEVMLDLSSSNQLDDIIRDFKPDYIFHLAAQSSVLDSMKNPFETWRSNLAGTLNLAESVSRAGYPIPTVFVTTDKVYKTRSDSVPFVETDLLDGSEPYSASKVACELLIKSLLRSHHHEEYGFKFSTVRSGNVIGGGDWSPHRLVPDLYRSVLAKVKASIRNPSHIRPWQHVLEPLYGYLLVALKLVDSNHITGMNFNFGPSDLDQISVQELVSKFGIPFVRATITNSETSGVETESLKLDSTLANRVLNWNPQLNIDQTVGLTRDWYNAFVEQRNLLNLSEKQVEEFLEL